jgi:hypothetical protein
MEGNRHPELESLWDFAPLEIRGGNLVLAAEGGYPPKKRPAKAPLAGAMWFRRGRSVPRLSGRIGQLFFKIDPLPVNDAGRSRN